MAVRELYAAAFAALALCVALTSADAAVTRFKCQVSDGKTTMQLEFVFDDLTDDAFIIGNAGTSPVRAHIGSRAITFLEFLPTGVVQTTTIELSSGAIVHSRHTIIGELFPSQMRGKCTRS